MSDTYESDETVYRRYLSKRCEDDLGVLYLRHKDGLILFLTGIVHNPEDAEELMLDAFAEIAAGASLFSGRSSFKTWLFSIGKKKALMHLRRVLRVQTEPEEYHFEDEGALSPEAEFLKSERDRRLCEALSRLNGEYRQVLILLYFEQMTVEQICRVMKKSKKQVYHLSQRGRDALKNELEKSGFDYRL